MVSKYEQEELEQIQREYEESQKADKIKGKSWNPLKFWVWNWRTVLFWVVLSLLVRFIAVVL